MPRDKKMIHRATSDTSDVEVSSDEDKDEIAPEMEKKDEVVNEELEEKRKEQLKNVILKRSLALKKQSRERVGLTQKR
jgi:hypothetical protein